MSYAKQMIDVARTWLKHNPDPKSPFLRVPGLDKNRTVQDQLTPERLNRYAIAAGQTPMIAPLVEKVRKLSTEVTHERRQLNQHESQLEDAINAPKPGQDKYEVDDRHTVAGRWCLSWARSGYNTFDLSSDFVAATLLTDARALDVDLVRLPFPAILIMTPPGFAIGAEGRSYTRIHVAEISASDVRVLHAAEQVSRAISTLPPDDARSTLEELLLRPEAPQGASFLDKAGTQSLVTPGALRASASAGALYIYATDGVHVLDTLIDRDGLTWDAFDDLPDTVTDDADKRARHTLRQIVFGMLAYANAIDRAVEPRDAAPRRRAPGDKPRPEHWVVGRTVRIDPQLVRLAQSGNREALFRLKHRFIVRGHYRNQAHGPQRTLRTSRWIAPFWKGPEDGAALVHTYKLDEAEGPTTPERNRDDG